ncbi:MAG: glycerol-3-phosphate ABC transporter ATP-binding protein [Chloroflexi bacterium RBG_16_68_14]|nr:MAG: glycerol-3-phosphate ABC transporter ATP-binding protein [Chloroflexi bacterium RBG_16_68_14]
MARVFFEGISKRFGAVLALSALTLEVRDGEFFVLLGPSGCGKTTALRIAAGLEEPSEGSIYIGDRLVNEVPAKDRDLAMVFQSYALYPHLSVYDNVAFGLRMRKYSRSEIDRLVRETAATLGIQELLRRRPAALSGGQQQRVALGRAIVRRPQAFLMDEPLSNLDAKMRVQMRAELVRLHRELRGTFIYVTHDQVEAMTMGERVAVLHQGLLQQVGTPQEVYDRPANLFVAEFIGSPAMNLLEAEPVRVDGQPGLRTADAFVRPLAALWAVLEAAGARSAVVGIRPEHLAPQEGENAEFAACFEGQVDLVESLGSEQHVTVALPRGSLVLRLPAARRLPIGSPLRLAVAPVHLQLFDAETGRRIGP